MTTYQVELAVCFEDNTWELYNVPVEADPPISSMTALNLGKWELAHRYPELKYVSVGLYHVMDSGADE